MKQYLLFLLAIGICLGAQAQRTLSGVILDENHKSLPGVSIIMGAMGTVTDAKGHFSISLPKGVVHAKVAYVGYNPFSFTVGAGKPTIKEKGITILQQTDSTLAVQLSISPNTSALEEVVVTGYGYVSAAPSTYSDNRYEKRSDESYSPIQENRFHNSKNTPLSTFSVDVDRASYTNIRRFLNYGSMPPVDAVRIEEMINYFDYGYKAPRDSAPVAIFTDMASCPWAPEHQLVRIGLKAKNIPTEKLPSSNLVFLLDVSGSMNEENKLPLVKKALGMLVEQLRPQDKVAIVVYAGAAGLVLSSTHGDHKEDIMEAIDNLSAGGSTAGGAGIELAYATALENLIPHGNNRVILATDGDFNVGVSDEEGLESLITKERKKGISLSVLGFGMGNLKDNTLELLADKGNGNYGYIDNLEEARRTFVTEFGGTLFTVAKDVKLQVEFNPKLVKSYRLVGYENRLLNDEDFKDDKKDAGDMGAGQTVTALYEIEPADGAGSTDTLKYQYTAPMRGFNNEALTVKMRYKTPEGEQSRLITKVLPWQNNKMSNAPEDFRMATAVADFGMLLRKSRLKGQASYQQVLDLANGAKGDDTDGYRAEFIELVKKAAELSGKKDVAQE
jgi:Ca-activated chloride channel homolog